MHQTPVGANGTAGRAFVAFFVLPPLWLSVLAVAVSCALVIALFGLGSKPVSVGLFPAPWDKLAHYLFYGGLAGTFWVALRGAPGWAAPGAFLLAVAVGIADEWVQFYTPGRDASLGDLAADALGALTAVVVLTSTRRRLTTVERIPAR